jgi:hypothetical protein
LKPGRLDTVAVLLLILAPAPRAAWTQTLSQRGFLEGRGVLFPQEALNDPTQVVADFVGREELFAKPTPWLQFAGGIDIRANSHEQVEDSWRVDFGDRGIQRPRLSVRRAAATITRGRLTVDVGKQFIRWGKADILNPTDRFAPRDFLNVIDAEFLAVSGVRGTFQAGTHDAFEVVWLPRLTPSRIPLLNQRWAPVPAMPVLIVDAGSVFPEDSQMGFRWSRNGTPVEWSISYFDGFNHLPNIVTPPGRDVAVSSPPVSTSSVVPQVDIVRIYPTLRSYGGDVAMPSSWFTVKGEVAYFTTTTAATDEYVLFVVQLERQTGEWVFVGGYAGEVVTANRATLAFAPDRGLTKSVIGRASYTIDPNRSLAFETAIRQTLSGAYFRAEYSQAYGQHWRATASGALIRGEPDDFLGQYRLNSYGSIVLRYSF